MHFLSCQFPAVLAKHVAQVVVQRSLIATATCTHASLRRSAHAICWPISCRTLVDHLALCRFQSDAGPRAWPGISTICRQHKRSWQRCCVCDALVCEAHVHTCAAVRLRSVSRADMLETWTLVQSSAGGMPRVSSVADGVAIAARQHIANSGTHLNSMPAWWGCRVATVAMEECCPWLAELRPRLSHLHAASRGN